MSTSKINVSINPTGIFAVILAAVFVTLKLTGAIGWSWLWVTSPLWLPFVAALALTAVWLLFLLVAAGAFLLLAFIFDKLGS